MTLVAIIFIALFIVLIGYICIDRLSILKKESIVGKLSLGWGLGVGLIGLQLFLYSILQIPWSRFSLLLPWIPFIIFFFIKRFRIPNFKMNHRFSNIERILIIFLILLNLFVAFEAVLRPVQAWDGWDNWLLRPKVFYMNNDLSLDYVRYTHDDYPLIMPLMDTFGYIIIGGIDDKNILFFYFMFYLALGGLFFAASQKLFGTKLALLYTFLLLSLQNLIRHGGRFEAGQSDLALGYYIFTGALLLAYFFKTKNKFLSLLLSIFLGITAQIKNDGMAYFLIVNTIIVAVSIYWKKFSYILYLLPGFLLVGSWTLYKILNDYPSNFLFRNGLDIHYEKTFAIIGAMLKEMINFQNWNLLWVIFATVLLLNWKNLGKAKLFLLLLLLQWLSYFAIFMITPREPVGHVQNVIDKLYLHLAPLATFISALLITKHLEIINKIKQIKSSALYKWIMH